MAVTSRWFPPIFALLQAVRHLGMIAYDYWRATQNYRHFDAAEFIHKDLARSFFEPYGFCGAWTQYTSSQSAVLGLDLPIYAVGSMLHSAMTGGFSCVDALTPPRGRILGTALALPVWFFVGLGVRRLARHQWRNKVEGRIKRALIGLGLIPLPFGVLFLLLSVASLFVSDLGLSVRAAGFAIWFLYTSALAAERLRIWPLNRLAVKEPA